MLGVKIKLWGLVWEVLSLSALKEKEKRAQKGMGLFLTIFMHQSTVSPTTESKDPSLQILLPAKGHKNKFQKGLN